MENILDWWVILFSKNTHITSSKSIGCVWDVNAAIQQFKKLSSSVNRIRSGLSDTKSSNRTLVANLEKLAYGDDIVQVLWEKMNNSQKRHSETIVMSRSVKNIRTGCALRIHMVICYLVIYE